MATNRTQGAIQTTRRYARAVVIAALAALVAPAETRAQLGDGTCQPEEASKQQCAVLGGYSLEIVPADGEFPVIGTCQVNNAPVACAFWPYRFAGGATDNQLNLLVPASLAVYTNQLYTPTNTSFAGCQQLYAPGAGDPTTGFGKGIITYKTCRIALNVDVGPGTPNFVVATSLAAPGADPVQLKSGKNIFFDDVQGPSGSEVPRLATTTEAITTRSGAMLLVETNQVGTLLSATSNTGPVTVIPPGIAVLCTPFDPNNVFPTNFPGQYDCGPIVENLDGTNLQAGENSTCYYRRKDGSLLKYTC